MDAPGALPMNILLLTHYFAPENGAPQRRWAALAERFAAAGHEVSIICPAPHYPHGRLQIEHRRAHRAGSVTTDRHGVTVHRVSFLPHDGGIVLRTLDHIWVAAATVRRARRLQRSGRIPDVVVATAPALPTLLAGRTVARRFGVPLVAEMRDAWPDLVSHTPGLAQGRGIVAAVKRRVHHGVTMLQRNAARVVTTTESFAQVLGRRGIERTSVIRNGTSLERYAVVPPRQPDHDELRVLYMGTVGRSQGLDVVVQAAARARDVGVPLQVRIVGQGAALPGLRALNERLGRPVEILGAVPGPEVLPFYAWADTCIVSLRDWEPFRWTVPSKLYELMAAGRHMTAIVAGESARLVSEAECGDIVTPGDAEELAELWAALHSQPSKLDIGDTGRRWVAQHAEYDALAGHYLELLSATS